MAATDTRVRHRRYCSIALAFTLAILLRPASAAAQWTDDFESYVTGSFPSPGGWQLLYNGLGSGYQYVGVAPAAKGGKALHQTGASCWSSVAYRSFGASTDSVITCEANVLMEAVTSIGCESSPGSAGSLGFMNPTEGTWGTYYVSVVFGFDGRLYGGGSSVPYQTNVWYHLAIVTNLSSHLATVYVNNVQLGTSSAIPQSGVPSGVYTYAGHGSSPTIWFDDIVLTRSGTTTPARRPTWGSLKTIYR